MTPDSFRQGHFSSAEQMHSPNQDERPQGQSPELVVVHNISLPPGEFEGDAVEAFFTNRLDFDAHPWFDQIRALKVSSHFYLRRDGKLRQFVSVDKRAWHAGVSCWQGRETCNDFSVGIELQGTDDQPFEEIQYHQLNKLLLALYTEYPAIKAVTGHSDIAPGRKTDPGPCFDWNRVVQPGKCS